MTREKFDIFQPQGATAIVDEITHIPRKDHLESEMRTDQSALPRDEAIIAGIMVAVKEMKFHELYWDRSCDTHPR